MDSVPFRYGSHVEGPASLPDAATSDPTSDSFRAALRQARLTEAAHAEAVMGLRDAKSIRLQLLKDDLLPIVSANRDAADMFDLALIAGDEPRLWIDLVSFVLMEPDPRTYRLVEDRQSGREILIESDQRPAVVERIRQLMAHRIVARQRMAPSVPALPQMQGYSVASLILAWLSGLALGALGLLAWVIYAGRIRL